MKNYKQEVYKLVERYGSRLTPNDLNGMRDLISAGEEQCAFENLCQQIFERDILCSKEEYEEIAVMGQTLKLKPAAWVFLNPAKDRHIAYRPRIWLSAEVFSGNHLLATGHVSLSADHLGGEFRPTEETKQHIPVYGTTLKLTENGIEFPLQSIRLSSELAGHYSFEVVDRSKLA